jgi:hypothetical protein
MAYIVAPPCVGKSFWVGNNPTWTDQDVWAKKLKIHTEEWHLVKHSVVEEEEHYRIINEYTKAARAKGIKLIGALYTDGIVPDAIVLIDPALHEQRCALRDDVSWENVKKVTKWMSDNAAANGVEKFDNFDDASKCCEHLISAPLPAMI